MWLNLLFIIIFSFIWCVIMENLSISVSSMYQTFFYIVNTEINKYNRINWPKEKYLPDELQLYIAFISLQ